MTGKDIVDLSWIDCTTIEMQKSKALLATYNHWGDIDERYKKKYEIRLTESLVTLVGLYDKWVAGMTEKNLIDQGELLVEFSDYPWGYIMVFPLTFKNGLAIDIKKLRNNFIFEIFNWYPYEGIG